MILYYPNKESMKNACFGGMFWDVYVLVDGKWCIIYDDSKNQN